MSASRIPLSNKYVELLVLTSVLFAAAGCQRKEDMRLLLQTHDRMRSWMVAVSSFVHEHEAYPRELADCERVNGLLHGLDPYGNEFELHVMSDSTTFFILSPGPNGVVDTIFVEGDDLDKKAGGDDIIRGSLGFLPFPAK